MVATCPSGADRPSTVGSPALSRATTVTSPVGGGGTASGASCSLPAGTQPRSTMKIVPSASSNGTSTSKPVRAVEWSIAGEELLVGEVAAGQLDGHPLVVGIERVEFRQHVTDRHGGRVPVGFHPIDLGASLGAPSELPDAERHADDREDDGEREISGPAAREREPPAGHRASPTWSTVTPSAVTVTGKSRLVR